MHIQERSLNMYTKGPTMYVLYCDIKKIDNNDYMLAIPQKMYNFALTLQKYNKILGVNGISSVYFCEAFAAQSITYM